MKAPLDLLACPFFDWGCRFLRLDHRLLVQEKPEGEALFNLRTGDGDLSKLLLRVEALFLRNRSFRFADFSFSEFYDADLTDADLRGALLRQAKLQGAYLVDAQLQDANLGGAQLQGANLWRVQLQGAGLWDAQLQGADLLQAQLQGADLLGAQLQGADLLDARLQGANLGGAQLQGADLWRAQLQGADLRGAQLQGADLRGVQLQGANLGGAQLQGADLRSARLQGANLGGAQLQGADLGGAQLQGADLREAGLWQAPLSKNTDFSLADLRGIQLQPVSAEGLAGILQSLDGIPERRRQKAADRVTKALTPAPSPAPRPVVRIEAGKPALAGAKPPAFADFGGSLTTDKTAYDAALAPFLAGLAASDAAVARGIVQRALSSQWPPDTPEARRRLWPDLAQRLLAAEKEGAVKLGLPPHNRKALEDVAAKAPPPSPRKKTR